MRAAEGDGEISFCGAIEMAGVITINFKVMKNGVSDLGLKSPIYMPGPVEPQFGPGRHIYFEGFSVDSHGKQHYMDVTTAYRQTSLREFTCPFTRLAAASEWGMFRLFQNSLAKWETCRLH